MSKTKPTKPRKIVCPACVTLFPQPSSDLIICSSCHARWWTKEAIRSGKEIDELVTGVELFDWRAAGSRHYSVYIVLLRNVPKIRGNAYYVGMTGISPEERFLNHKRGIKSSRWVKRYGVALLREFYAHFKPMKEERALQMEEQLAEKLLGEGFEVFGGH
jgi:hypothetical protein